MQACLNSAIDDLAAAPASLKRAPQATFCFALHSDAAPEELLQWLRSNLQWAARALRWIDCHQLHHSAPENDTETLLQTESVVLSSASLLVDSAEHSAIETSIAQVRLPPMAPCMNLFPLGHETDVYHTGMVRYPNDVISNYTPMMETFI